MPANTVRLDIDKTGVVPALQEALEKLNGAGGEVLLDFSSVDRVDAGALKLMEKLAATADEKAVKVGLRGVNVRTYKALKLVKLSERFSFQS
ncbi:MAG TPA: STAS domain-containing protein [Bryobacteraceae bacterium]|nr:STAS domain-containing protein [Bryobacteraceae bacterium]